MQTIGAALPELEGLGRDEIPAPRHRSWDIPIGEPCRSGGIGLLKLGS